MCRRERLVSCQLLLQVLLQRLYNLAARSDEKELALSFFLSYSPLTVKFGKVLLPELWVGGGGGEALWLLIGL